MTPPGEWIDVRSFAVAESGNRIPSILEVDLLLYCADELCLRDQQFRSIFSGRWVTPGKAMLCNLDYVCRNCQKSRKVFALWIHPDGSGKNARILKLGERPEFGPPLSPRVLKLVAADIDELRKGYKSERQGLGVGAYGAQTRTPGGADIRTPQSLASL
jgi:hypothetical protein